VRAAFIAVIGCAVFASAVGAAPTAIPKPKYPACKVVRTAAITTIVGQKAMRQAPALSGNRFQLSQGPGGHALQISLCSWTYGQPDPNAPTPGVATVTVTYFAAATRAAAADEYAAIKRMTAPKWQAVHRVGDAAAAESGPSGQSFAATAIARRRNQILKVDVVTPTEDGTAQRSSVAILRRAASLAWRR
jgi:hypothetical protein